MIVIDRICLLSDRHRLTYNLFCLFADMPSTPDAWMGEWHEKWLFFSIGDNGRFPPINSTLVLLSDDLIWNELGSKLKS
jgi:hypothetical protein